MKGKLALSIAMTLLAMSCRNATDKNEVSKDNNCPTLQIQSEIESVIKWTKDCNKRKDIDCFMSSFDSLFVLESNEATDKGRTILKDTVKKDILRDWGIIVKMLEVEQWIDSIYVFKPDSAVVFTNQFYHRTFTKPQGQPGEDDVVTTQKHREIWIKRDEGWKQQRVRELGGSVYVNGKPYDR